jgi:hypothetical protein
MLYDRDDKMARLTFLHEFDIDDSMEKRARSLGLPWPPWVILGRRVFTPVSAHKSGLPSRRPRARRGVRPRDRWERGRRTNGPSPPKHQHRQRRW